MAAGHARSAAAEPDPERAAIILDRLAAELERALSNNPKAVADLLLDARELLICLTPWLAREDGALACAAHAVAATAEPLRLARGLGKLAARLLELADHAEGASRGGLAS